jgi:transcription elongation GreA/GreB family factor
MNVQALDKVEIGTWCRVTGFVPGTETVFHFVPDSEVDYDKHKVPMKGPLRALIGAEAGDKVVADFAGEKVELAVLEVGPD